MAILLSAIVALLPLILAPGLFYYYDITPKIVVLLTGTAIGVILARRGMQERAAELRLFGMLLLAQGVSLAVSTAFSTDVAVSLGGSMWRRFGLLTQVAMLLFTWFAAQWAAVDAGRVRHLLRVIAVAGIPAAVYGILQYFGWDPLIDRSLYHIGEAPLTIVRPPGTLGYVSYFATYLLSVIFAGAALVLAEESHGWKLTGAAASVLGALAATLTGTRAAMLGLVAGLLFLAVGLRPRARAGALAAAIATALGIGGFYLSPAGQMLRSRMQWFVEDPLGGGRLLLWRDSFRMYASRWPLGFGPDTFSIHFPQYQSPELARVYPHFFQESPHNIFIDALAGQGIPGIAVLIGLTALGFQSAWKMRYRAEAAALGACLLALLISQEFTSFTLPTAVFFYLTIALLVALASEPVNLPAFKGGTIRTVCFVLLAALFPAFAIALAVTDAGLARVDRLIRAGKPVEAASIYATIRRWQPPGVRTDLWYSRAMAGASQRTQNSQESLAAAQQALAAAVRASRSSDEPQNAWLNLAVFYGRQNDPVHSEQSLRAAISCAPSWFKPHWLLAQVLRVTGRLQEARAEALLAADLDGGKDPEVAHTAAEIIAATK